MTLSKISTRSGRIGISATKRVNSSLALDRLRELIDANETQPDWRLPPERELSIKIGVGRNAVRRALEVLEAEGRLWRHQGKGTFLGQKRTIESYMVSSLADRASPLEIMEARLSLEPRIAQLAAQNASQEDLATLKRIFDRLISTSDDDGLELWDSAFHRAIAVASGNSVMVGLFDVIDQIRQTPDWRTPREQARTEERLKAYSSHHAAILHAISSRDGASSAKAMQDHLFALQEHLRQALEKVT
jgi:DNA-binding FadR family transcriptional regulator